MSNADITISIRDSESGVTVLDLAGRLTGRAENPLLDAHIRVSSQRARTVVLNFAGLEVMDGGGLSLLVVFSTWTDRKGQRLTAYGLSTRCRRIFEELGLGSRIRVYSTEAAAVRSGRAADEPSPGAAGSGEACPAANWASHLGRAHLPPVPEGFSGLNVDGREICGPMDGFGQLLHKVYTVRLTGSEVSPAEVIQLCKEQLGDFWPRGNRLHVPAPGIEPGAVGLIELTLPGGVPLATGIRVLHAGKTSFTFVTLAGHLEAGWICFSAYKKQACTTLEVASLARTSDPIYELGFSLFGHSQQERFWRTTLENVAEHFGVSALARVTKDCLNSRRHWGKAGNLLQNAATRTGLSLAASLLSKAFAPRNR
jgi:anti-anti-sigma factor